VLTGEFAGCEALRAEQAADEIRSGKRASAFPSILQRLVMQIL